MKQINLSDSKIVGAHINVRNDIIENIVIEGKVFDDSGNVISTDNYVAAWGSFSIQTRQTINKLMRVLSQEYNRVNVNEDTETWVDNP